MFKAREAKVPTVSLEGVPLLTAFSHSPVSGWIVAARHSGRDRRTPRCGATLAVTTGIGMVLLADRAHVCASAWRGRSHAARRCTRCLINELNHRVKNTLATVQSIATQTFREASDPAEARRKFDARLAALGRAHNVLSNEKWDGR